MLFYIGIFLFLICFLVLDFVKDGQSIKSFLFYLLVLSFVFLGGIRWETGTDWNNYYSLFNRSGSENAVENETTFEIGFRYFNFLARKITDSYTVFLLVSGLFIILTKSAYLKNNTKYFFLALFLYYAYFFCDVFFVRQSIAISLTLVSTTYIVKRKFIPFSLIIAGASLFHSSAVLFIIAYFVYSWKIPTTVIVIAVLLSILYMAMGLDTVVFKFLAPRLGFNEFIANRLNEYLEKGKESTFGSNVSKTTILILGVFKRGLLLPLFLWVRANIEREKKVEFNGYLNLVVLGTILFFLTAGFVALQRVITYFAFYEILLLLMVVGYLHKRISIPIIYFFLILYAFSKFYYGFAGYKDLYVPYYSIFDSKINRRDY
ncbi:EpsG family protein [Danxiaibacter flavus]|uniref:EpsG family protein n=1 Tax=Danxiaibacter flavus TaxID=3049108 RepID=A0ABV3ZIU8_9BACT|nr:EpsG family protein [Chitinophagaceae bacterium DXS]